VTVAPDCTGAVKQSIAKSKDLLKKLDLSDAAAARIEKQMIDHCTEDKWSADVVTCIADARAEDTDRCIKQLPQPQREKLMASLQAIIEQEHKVTVPVPPEDPKPPEEPAGSASSATSGDPLPPEEPATPVDSNALPPSCVELKAEVSKLDRCKAVPSATRKAMRDSYAIIAKTWRDLTHSAVLRENTEKSCRVQLDAIVELRKASSCR
jgi:histone H3/H4